MERICSPPFRELPVGVRQQATNRNPLYRLKSIEPVASVGTHKRCKEAGCARYGVIEVVSISGTTNAGGTTGAPLVLLEGGAVNLMEVL